jgi:hypothetical protein
LFKLEVQIKENKLERFHNLRNLFRIKGMTKHTCILVISKCIGMYTVGCKKIEYSCGQIKLGSNFFYCKSELNIKSPEKSSPRR